MAVLAQDRPVTLIEGVPAADPAPLGLAAFALTTFLLSGHNASFIPDAIWIGPALFYGGIVQLLAGMWEFRNRNVFGATAFSTYGGFWLGLGSVVVLADVSKTFAASLAGANLTNALAWFLLAFAVFNTYMLLWSMRVSVAVFGVFLTLEITEIVLVIGFFNLSPYRRPPDLLSPRQGQPAPITSLDAGGHPPEPGRRNPSISHSRPPDHLPCSAKRRLPWGRH